MSSFVERGPPVPSPFTENYPLIIASHILIIDSRAAVEQEHRCAEFIVNNSAVQWRLCRKGPATVHVGAVNRRILLSKPYSALIL